MRAKECQGHDECPSPFSSCDEESSEKQNTVEVFTRGAAAVSRRTSLLTLGGAGPVAALAGGSVADAGKKGKKTKKKCNAGTGVACLLEIFANT